MIFDIPTYIEAMMRSLTLYPGDVVKVENTGIGVPRNRFVRMRRRQGGAEDPC